MIIFTGTTIGYNDLNNLIVPGGGYFQNLILRHVYKNVLSLFRAFLSAFGFKVTKRCTYDPKTFSSQTFKMGLKIAVFDHDFKLF